MSLASQDGGYFYFKVLDSYRGSRDIRLLSCVGGSIGSSHDE